MTDLLAVPVPMSLEAAARAYREAVAPLDALRATLREADARCVDDRGVVIGERADREARLAAEDALALQQGKVGAASKALHGAALAAAHPAPSLSESEQAAFETFGEAWMQLRQIEQAVAHGEGASFTHHSAIQEMQRAAQGLRSVLTAHPAPAPALVLGWRGFPSAAPDCPNWGNWGGRWGPCNDCPACWIRHNYDDLKELMTMTQTKTLIDRLGTRTALIMNGPEEGTYATINDEGTATLRDGRSIPLNLGTPDEVYLMAATEEEATR